MGCTSATTQTAGCVCEGGDTAGMSRVGRRVFLVAGAGLLAGCSDSSAQNQPGPAPTTPAPPTSAPPASAPSTPVPSVPTTPSPTPTVVLPSVRAWVPGPGEVQPEVKRLAVAAVVKLLRPTGTPAAIEVID